MTKTLATLAGAIALAALLASPALASGSCSSWERTCQSRCNGQGKNCVANCSSRAQTCKTTGCFNAVAEGRNHCGLKKT